jgi:2-polyprenyl-3-methyl-5-hydroxy-6-metoxy-1,4-benzoquinol methylase
VPRRVRIGVAAEPTLRQMGRETDFAKRAWIEPPPAPGTKPWNDGETRNGRGTVAAERRGTGYRLRAEMDEPGWVVISETAWKGWQATAGGRALPLGIANHAFLALELPAGLHTVDLAYRPRGFLIGRWITGLTLGLLAVAAFAGWRRRAGRATPDEADDVRRVGDRVAVPGGYQHRALHQGPAPQRFWHDAKLSEALRLLEIRPGLTLLDAGCGSGLLTDRAAAAGARVLAVDANPAAIEFARRTFARPGVEFRLGLLDELDLPRDHFDRIVFLEVIEHLGRKQGSETLARFRDLLVPGGRLVLSTPNRKSLWPLIEWLLDHLRLVPPLAGEQHETLYSLDELTAAAESQGLRTAERRMINTLAPWLAWISPRLAGAVHGWELRHVRRHGSIMLVAFEKPPAGPATSA